MRSAGQTDLAREGLLTAIHEGSMLARVSVQVAVQCHLYSQARPVTNQQPSLHLLMHSGTQAGQSVKAASRRVVHIQMVNKVSQAFPSSAQDLVNTPRGMYRGCWDQ